VDRPFIAQAAGERTAGVAFICGSNGFVESAGELLLEAGFEAGQIRTERFGPT
jgi:ferredoxin-NADP reductase